MSGNGKRNIVPGDQIGNNLTGVARSVMTRSVTLSGKTEIIMPEGCYEVNIKSPTSITFYESAGTYERGGITYGDGYSGNNMTMPVWGRKSFWLNGSGVVTLLFSSIREV